MNLVQAVEARNSDFLQGFFLDFGDDADIFFLPGRAVADDIEN